MSSSGLRSVAVLALAQGILGVLRALQWFQVGSDLSHTGLLLVPLIGVVALARGTIVGTIALLYVVFAWGALTGKSWTRAVGLTACALNVLVVLVLVLDGDSLAAALLWAVAPVIIGAYLLRAWQPAPAR
jgi:hypothetical protein